MSAGVSFASVERLVDRLARPLDEGLGELLQLGAGQRHLEVDRARTGRRVMNGRLISVVWADDSSIFAFSAASRMRWRAIRSARQVDALLLLELGDDPVHDGAVEVVAAEERVAVGGEHLDDALADAQDRDVERAAAEVVDGDHLFACRPCRARRRAPRRSAR